MPHADLLILYVDNPRLSERFYADLLGRPALESSPTFVMFLLTSGLKLGLWSRHTVEPAAAGSMVGGAELAFSVENAADVDTLYANWGGRGMRVAQKPVDLDFGRTFVMLDPDSHRLRVLASLP